MSDDQSISLVNLGKLSKPADTLIKKVSSAVGGLFEPWQIERVAKAQAKANLIKAQSEIQVTNLHRRAMCRFVEEEAQRQDNMENITAKALPQLEENSDPSLIEDDWVTNFFDKSRIVSDDEMQQIWAKVLAGEANSPGTFSKRTVNFLGDLDKRDAELFQNLCSFGWNVGAFTTLIFDPMAEIYNKKGINFNSLVHLDSIGLVQFQGLAGFNRTGLPKMFAASYCGKPLNLVLPNEENNELPIGHVILTNLGMELVTVCNSPGVDEFIDYVKEQWKQFLPT
ncbi:MAG: DUF2806 domain-containing protein [Candidatus Methylacidiphilales bacterium]|nr:DUF2806 domain-containing protein [Candidatus Methylacidiphilales bacterium]